MQVSPGAEQSGTAAQAPLVLVRAHDTTPGAVKLRRKERRRWRKRCMRSVCVLNSSLTQASICGPTSAATLTPCKSRSACLSRGTYGSGPDFLDQQGAPLLLALDRDGDADQPGLAGAGHASGPTNAVADGTDQRDCKETSRPPAQPANDSKSTGLMPARS
jgi:hypothetical protein